MLIIIPPSLIASSYLTASPADKPTLSKAPITPPAIPPAPAAAKAAAIGPAIAKPIHGTNKFVPIIFIPSPPHHNPPN